MLAAFVSWRCTYVWFMIDVSLVSLVLLWLLQFVCFPAFGFRVIMAFDWFVILCWVILLA